MLRQTHNKEATPSTLKALRPRQPPDEEQNPEGSRGHLTSMRFPFTAH